jgi:hypothetical protein
MVCDQWERMMPEAYEESQEILLEVARVRPEWLYTQPDLRAHTRQRLDWSRPSGGFWDRLRHSLDREASLIIGFGQENLDRARQEAVARRAHVKAARQETAMLDLGNLRATLSKPLDGWKGDPVEPWRIAGLQHANMVLRSVSSGHPYHDWLLPVMNVRQALDSGAAWVSFWLYDVTPARMPRHWIRWAFETATSVRRMSPGTPTDIQLATYLVTSDYFVSADRILCQLIDECRQHSPVALATTVMVPSGREGVTALLDFLKRRRQPGDE